MAIAGVLALVVGPAFAESAGATDSATLAAATRVGNGAAAQELGHRLATTALAQPPQTAAEAQRAGLAAALLRQAVQNSQDSEAAWLLSQMYSRGIGAGIDPALAQSYARVAAKGGVGVAAFSIAQGLLASTAERAGTDSATQAEIDEYLAIAANNGVENARVLLANRRGEPLAQLDARIALEGLPRASAGVIVVPAVLNAPVAELPTALELPAFAPRFAALELVNVAPAATFLAPPPPAAAVATVALHVGDITETAALAPLTTVAAATGANSNSGAVTPAPTSGVPFGRAAAAPVDRGPRLMTAAFVTREGVAAPDSAPVATEAGAEPTPSGQAAVNADGAPSGIHYLPEAEENKARLVILQRRLEQAEAENSALKSELAATRTQPAAGAVDGARLNREAVDLIRTGDYETAVPKLRRASELGSAEATANLGLMYLNGTGVAKDVQQAQLLLARAAESGNPGAAENLGIMYAYSIGAQYDRDRAFRWFQRAAQLGSQRAAQELQKLQARR